MTTTAVAGGFAVCQARLGAKVHDPKDPGADLGPMFSQVLGTILSLTERHADRWLKVRGSHDVPAYGFERVMEPPPLDVDMLRLLEEFHRGRLAQGEQWDLMLAPESAALVCELAADAGVAADNAARADAPRPLEQGMFSFPDEAWARVVYDVCVAARRRVLPIDRLVAALVPLYFGRVASLLLEVRDMTGDQAESVVERQARTFELAKPYLLARWEEASAAPATAGPAGPTAPAEPVS